MKIAIDKCKKEIIIPYYSKMRKMQNMIITFGEKIKRMREERKWSRGALGRHSGLCIATISLIESGKRGKNPAHSTVTALAKALGVPAETLYNQN